MESVKSTPEMDHVTGLERPIFRIRWAQDASGDDDSKTQVAAMKKLRTLLKKDRMELSHTDDDGFLVYASRPRA